MNSNSFVSADMYHLFPFQLSSLTPLPSSVPVAFTVVFRILTVSFEEGLITKYIS